MYIPHKNVTTQSTTEFYSMVGRCSQIATIEANNITTEANNIIIDLNEICNKILRENSNKYETKDDILIDCVYHLARYIGHEPIIKRFITKEFEQNGVISTQPTLKGRDVIEWTDELAAIKRLENKPILKFLHEKDSNNKNSNDYENNNNNDENKKTNPK
eukprot:114351_1